MLHSPENCNHLDGSDDLHVPPVAEKRPLMRIKGIAGWNRIHTMLAGMVLLEFAFVSLRDHLMPGVPDSGQAIQSKAFPLMMLSYQLGDSHIWTCSDCTVVWFAAILACLATGALLSYAALDRRSLLYGLAAIGILAV